MLSKFQVRYDWEELVEWAGVAAISLPPMPSKEELRHGHLHPVVRLSKKDGRREFVWMREGLIPSYACDERGAEQRAEAHAEAMTCDSCFRSAFRRRRCLIPANRLTERRHLAKGIEQPCAFQLETGGTFGIAAVWETWTNDQGHSIDSFAIVSALVIPTLRTLFDRMPVVLRNKDEQDRWLNVSRDHEHPPLDLLRPMSVAELRDWRMIPGDVDLQISKADHALHL